MIYRKFGKTGIDISALGFGGMRFESSQSPEDCAMLIQAGYDAGINYFDTAPIYCNGKSEEYYGRAFAEMKKTRTQKPFYVATKTFESREPKIRRDLENSLKRLGLDCIDFYYIWCILRPEQYRERVGRGLLDAFVRLKEQGLIRHICFSTHMSGNEIEKVIYDYPFDGVLLGYSAMNFAYREMALSFAEKAKCGVAVMNPLGGGLIPQNPQRFSFLKQRQEETVVEAALRFLLNDPRITTMLVGMGKMKHLQEALSAVDGFKAIPAENIEKIRLGLKEAFNELCTGCGYCNYCPEGIPVPKLMDSYNQYLLSHKKQAIADRMKWHWEIFYRGNHLDKCTRCMQCERSCTQHLPILARFQEIQKELPN
ncbi:MAG: aldo/keto reductase [Candidatus Brocadiae bacterium]|nr:aldo/keto reductase [Candidatus Brocadiia bacterium]